jgi:hypothetical protein
LQILKLNECGYDEAVIGFSLSYNSTFERTIEILPKYAFAKPGENKFLESICVWLDVDAPRFWWSEMDTYRVGMTKQSESSMHTLHKRPLEAKDFEFDVGPDWRMDLELLRLAYLDKKISIDEFKNYLPDGFLQRRIICTNYKTLQNIYAQRHDHRLPQWHYFCDELLVQLDHPEFIKRSENL